MEEMLQDPQLITGVQQIINERDDYRQATSIAHHAITELEFQIYELHRLLAKAHDRSCHCASTMASPRSMPKTWIGTWRCSPQEYPALAEVEKAWRDGHLQQALSFMPALVDRVDLGQHHRVNARLLYSSLLQSTSTQFPTALYYADEALQLACDHRLHELAGKAQFHRGLCYLYLGEPENASWCFLLASHLEDHERTIFDCRHKAIKSRDGLPVGDPKRMLSGDFKMFLHSEKEHFVG